MEFSDRKAKCKKVQITDMNGLPLSGETAFYALITDEAANEGTPLNAENMNKGNWRDDNTVCFMTNYDASINAKADMTQIYTAGQRRNLAHSACGKIRNLPT